MLKRSSTKKKRDHNEVAFIVAQKATDETSEVQAEDQPGDGKDPAAVALGRKGGKKGGKARAANMTPEERSEAARKAAKKRWKKYREEKKAE